MYNGKVRPMAPYAVRGAIWHQAKVKIEGETIVLTAPGLTNPCGVAYGCNGVGTLPGIYNKAMLPLTPFIYYENKLVTSDTWPMDHIKIAGKVIDPTSYGAQYEHRKLTLLSPQFRNYGVIQAGFPHPFLRQAGACVSSSWKSPLLGSMLIQTTENSSSKGLKTVVDVDPHHNRPMSIPPKRLGMCLAQQIGPCFYNTLASPTNTYRIGRARVARQTARATHAPGGYRDVMGLHPDRPPDEIESEDDPTGTY